MFGHCFVMLYSVSDSILFSFAIILMSTRYYLLTVIALLASCDLLCYVVLPYGAMN